MFIAFPFTWGWKSCKGSVWVGTNTMPGRGSSGSVTWPSVSRTVRPLNSSISPRYCNVYCKQHDVRKRFRWMFRLLLLFLACKVNIVQCHYKHPIPTNMCLHSSLCDVTSQLWRWLCSSPSAHFASTANLCKHSCKQHASHFTQNSSNALHFSTYWHGSQMTPKCGKGIPWLKLWWICSSKSVNK